MELTKYFIKVISYYSNPTFSQKCYLFLRWISAPFIGIERYIPKTGNYLDIGSGSGLMAMYLVTRSTKRNVVGIEPDTAKHALSRQLASSANILLLKGFFNRRLVTGKFDGVIIFDVFYLLSPADKKKMLIQAKKLLTPNGKIYLKTIPASSSFGFALGYIQEIVSVYVSKITFSKTKKMYFYTENRYLELFAEVGLLVEKKINLHTLLFHPHVLFVLTPK